MVTSNIAPASWSTMAIMLSSTALALAPIFPLPGGVLSVVLSDLDLFTVVEVTPTIGFHYGAIPSCISASLKCILPSHLCIVQAQCISGNVTLRETLGAKASIVEPMYSFHKIVPTGKSNNVLHL